MKEGGGRRRDEKREKVEMDKGGIEDGEGMN